VSRWAQQLPLYCTRPPDCRLLTFCVDPDDLVAVAAAWARAVEQAATSRDALDRAARWLSCSAANDDAKAAETLSALPEMLAVAAREGHGLLAVSG
jgi:hypothetical protein